MSQESPRSTASSPGEEIDLLDLFIVLAKYKVWLIGVPFAAALLACGVTLLMPNIYIGRSIIMPPQQQGGATAALLGALTGGAAAGLAGLKAQTPADLYVGMLESRSIADVLIKRFDLQKLYAKDTLVDTRRELADRSKISAGREGLITIEFENEDPKRAAAVANAYVEELDRLTQGLAITEAAQRRLFFERHLQQAKANLAEAEVAMKQTQEKTGIIRLDDQGRVIVEAAAALRAQVAAKEVELGAKRSTFATDQNPDVIRLQHELAGLRAQVKKMEQSQVAGGGDIFVPTGRVPEAGLEYIRRLREVKYQETMFELLAKQFEVARLDEAKEAAIIQIVDSAIAPDYKSKPRRAVIVIVVAFVAGMLTLVGAFISEVLSRAAVEDRARVAALKTHLRVGRRRD
jgi:tyrosine-protein kinase Etk/Wzc